MSMITMMMATMMMMTTMRRHLGICGYCREANTPHFHQHSLPDDDVRDDDDDDDNDGDDDDVRCDEDDDDHDDDDGDDDDEDDDALADDIISMCMYLFPKGKGIVYEPEIIHFGHKRQPSFLTTATFFKLYFGSKHFITSQISENSSQRI